VLGTIVGALAGMACYYAAPPPFRARATVNVDFHLEQAWPQNSDREQFYYLERETRKLMEIALSDATLSRVTDESPGPSIELLRSRKLQLSQPGSGGWHFYADDADPQRATLLAAAWAQAFVNQVEMEIIEGSTGGLEPFITVSAAQAENLVAERTPGIALFMLGGAGVLLALGAFLVLFIRFRP
jgi:hypothetical protein